MTLKLGDGIKLEVMHDVYSVVFVERVIFGPDICLLSNNKWYALSSHAIKHGRAVYKTDEMAGDIERHSLVITPRKQDLLEKQRMFSSVDWRSIDQIRPDEIIR